MSTRTFISPLTEHLVERGTTPNGIGLAMTQNSSIEVTSSCHGAAIRWLGGPGGVRWRCCDCNTDQLPGLEEIPDSAAFGYDSYYNDPDALVRWISSWTGAIEEDIVVVIR